MKALGEFILVERIKEQEQVKGIYVSSEGEMTKIGKVLSIGDAVDIDLKEGDSLIFTGGVELVTTVLEGYEDKEIFAVKKSQIIAKI